MTRYGWFRKKKKTCGYVLAREWAILPGALSAVILTQ